MWFVPAVVDGGWVDDRFTNAQAAAVLLQHLPTDMKGVVYLDACGQQLVLLRGAADASPTVLPLSQCGIGKEERFTFYDQVNRASMVTSRAVLTRVPTHVDRFIQLGLTSSSG